MENKWLGTLSPNRELAQLTVLTPRKPGLTRPALPLSGHVILDEGCLGRPWAGDRCWEARQKPKPRKWILGLWNLPCAGHRRREKPRQGWWEISISLHFSQFSSPNRGQNKARKEGMVPPCVPSLQATPHQGRRTGHSIGPLSALAWCGAACVLRHRAPCRAWSQHIPQGSGDNFT